MTPISKFGAEMVALSMGLGSIATIFSLCRLAIMDPSSRSVAVIGILTLIMLVAYVAVNEYREENRLGALIAGIVTGSVILWVVG